VYLNFIGDEGQDWVVACFGREHYACLAKIKARDDPDNVFHVNHTITPSGAGCGGSVSGRSAGRFPEPAFPAPSHR
jgi:hypothetical protein